MSSARLKEAFLNSSKAARRILLLAEHLDEGSLVGPEVGIGFDCGQGYRWGAAKQLWSRSHRGLCSTA
jgi:hypothetical protein